MAFFVLNINVNDFDAWKDKLQALQSQVYTIGPYQFGLSQADLQSVANQVLDTLQPVLGRFGSLGDGGVEDRVQQVPLEEGPPGCRGGVGPSFVPCQCQEDPGLPAQGEP